MDPNPLLANPHQPQNAICVIGRRSRLENGGGAVESVHLQFSKVARLLYDFVGQSKTIFPLRLIHLHIGSTAETAFLPIVDGKRLRSSPLTGDLVPGTLPLQVILQPSATNSVSMRPVSRGPVFFDSPPIVSLLVLLFCSLESSDPCCQAQ